MSVVDSHNLTSDGISRRFNSLRIQCVLFELPFERISRAADYLNYATKHAVAAGLLKNAELAYGDCSALPILSDEKLASLKAKNPYLSSISSVHFGENLGSAAGHNSLVSTSDADLTLIMNPDVLVAPNLLVELIRAIMGQQRPQRGLVEARQMPAEHPKEFDPKTGHTSWCSTACLLGLTSVITSVGGFDAETFFLYGDDVDLSWRVRLAGYAIAYQPTAVCFHDKRLADGGMWNAGDAERYFSAEAGLLLPYKYSRSDLTEEYLVAFRKSDDSALQKAAAAFEERRRSGKLPIRLDAEHRVSQFPEGAYAQHRFKTR
jgi:hypothetical protein